MNTKNVIDATFPEEVLQSDKPTLVDLWAPWCGPCKMIAPVVEEIATEQADRFNVTKLNIDENPQVTQKFGIRAIPTLLFFKDGELRDQLVGTASKKAILSRLEALSETQSAA